MLDFAAIKAAALAQARGLVPTWLPDGVERGREWVSTNPTRADASPGSFSVNLETGLWSDFATGDKGGDLISLYAYVNQCKQGEAARKVADMVGLATATNGTGNGAKAHKVERAPVKWKDGPRPDEAACERLAGRYGLAWADFAAAGCEVRQVFFPEAQTRLWAVVYPTQDHLGTKAADKAKSFYRFDTRTGSTVESGGKRLATGKDDPLFVPTGMEGGGPVIYTGGEEKALALRKAGFVAVSGTHGEKIRPEHVVWIVEKARGRGVVVCYDADTAGSDEANKTCAAIKRAGMEPRCVDWPVGVPDKWDIADALKGGGVDAVRSIIARAAYWSTGRVEAQAGEEEKKGPRLKFESMAALARREFAPIRWVVPNIIPEGYCLISGPPKGGKSLLALSLAQALAHGGYALGCKEYKCEKGNVLYLALEDTPRRIKEREAKMRQMNAECGAPDNLFIVDAINGSEVPPLTAGGIDWIREAIKAIGNVRLCIVDPLTCLRANASRGKGDTFQLDAEEGKMLRNLAHEFQGLCLMVVHHTRKPTKGDTADPHDATSGTRGIQSPADCLINFDTVRGENAALLHITGRDVESCTVPLMLKKESMLWVRDIAGAAKSPEQAMLLNILVAQDRPMTPEEVSEVAGKARGAIRTALHRMKKSGLVDVDQYGRYTFAKSETERNQNVANIVSIPPAPPSIPPSIRGGIESVTGVRSATGVTSVTGVTPPSETGVTGSSVMELPAISLTTPASVTVLQGVKGQSDEKSLLSDILDADPAFRKRIVVLSSLSNSGYNGMDKKSQVEELARAARFELDVWHRGQFDNVPDSAFVAAIEYGMATLSGEVKP